LVYAARGVDAPAAVLSRLVMGAYRHVLTLEDEQKRLLGDVGSQGIVMLFGGNRLSTFQAAVGFEAPVGR
jgi:light-regulated signal transduction histidine kinase (bacteriophytochrome)